MVRVFANGSGDRGSIPGRVIPKTQKMVLDVSLLKTQHYKVRIKSKVGQSRERSSAPTTPWCSSYRKGSPRVTFDFGRQLYLLYTDVLGFSILILLKSQNLMKPECLAIKLKYCVLAVISVFTTNVLYTTAFFGYRSSLITF